ncbi:MAG: TlpA family protein disulfide reductase [Caldilineaceae bacterium]|nr:TlpA family protein disulfide reductase [Caldilineaceae bacterium]
MNRLQLISTFLAGALLLSACAPAPASTDMEPAATEEATKEAMAETTEEATEEAMEEMTEEATEEAMAEMTEEATEEAMAEMTEEATEEAMAEMTEEATEEAMAEMTEEATEEAMVGGERPAWQLISLTDARTGASFTLADFAGKTVFVEPFATWCSNCRQQLTNVQAARTAFGDDVVFVTLSVEPNIGNEALVNYADGAGFDWIFAAMPAEMLQALAAEYGQTVSNPPATPHFIVRPDGSATPLVTGIESTEAIIEQIEAARS